LKTGHSVPSLHETSSSRLYVATKLLIDEVKTFPISPGLSHWDLCSDRSA